MKQVFSNEQCAHVWAQQTQPSGRSSNGTLYFEGPVIYSYGHHFPLACFIDQNTVMVNISSYSTTTAKHQRIVYGAVSHKTIIRVPVGLITSFLRDKTFNTLCQTVTVEICKNSVDTHMRNATQKKAVVHKAKDIRKAREEVAFCKRIFDVFETPYPDELISIDNMLNTDDSRDLVRAYEIMLAQRVADIEAKEKMLQNRLEKDILKNWIHGFPLEGQDSIFLCKKIFMRINGDEVVTSRGARFPVDHAIKAFSLIKTCKDRGEGWAKNGHTIHLGHFEIDSISPDGTVKAGCHTVQWDEISRIATLLNVNG